MVDFKFNENPALIFLGPRKSGKSFLIEKIIKKEKENYDNIIIFTNGSGVEKYKKITDSKLIFPKYDSNVLKKMIEINDANKNKFKILVIFDDCISMKQKYDHQIGMLFTEGRWHNCTTIFSAQSSGYLDLNWKKNIDKLILTKAPTGSSMRTIREEFMEGVLTEEELGTKKEKNELNRIIREYTKGYNCLCIDLLSEMNSSEDTFLMLPESF